MNSKESIPKLTDKPKIIQLNKLIGCALLSLSILFFVVLFLHHLKRPVQECSYYPCHYSFSGILSLIFYIGFDFALLGLSVYFLIVNNRIIKSAEEKLSKQESERLSYERSYESRITSLNHEIIRQVLTDLSKAANKDDEDKKKEIIKKYKEEITEKIQDIKKVLDIFEPITHLKNKTHD